MEYVQVDIGLYGHIVRAGTGGACTVSQGIEREVKGADISYIEKRFHRRYRERG